MTVADVDCCAEERASGLLGQREAWYSVLILILFQKVQPVCAMWKGGGNGILDCDPTWGMVFRSEDRELRSIS